MPPETRQKSPVARAMALRDAVNQALTGPSDLKPFERELRNWANAEVQAAVLARGATGSPARKAVAVGDSPVAEARPSFFRDFFGDDAGAIIEDYRQGGE